jgi:hypothetical protein
VSWKRAGEGKYARTDGAIDALVIQDGELWRSYVHVDGEIVDQGEWDGRGQAFRNAYGAMKRAKSLRAPLGEAARLEEEDDNEL